MALGGYSIGDRVYLFETKDQDLLGLVGTVVAVEQREVTEGGGQVWLNVELDGYGTHCQKATAWERAAE